MKLHIQKGHLSKACRGALIAIVAIVAVTVAVNAQSKSPRKATTLSPIDVVSHHMDEQSVTLLQNAKVRHTRTTLYPYYWSNPSYEAEFATGIERLRKANIEVTVIVHDPSWGSYDTRETDYRDYSAFVAARVRQFPYVKNWQLWNEQNAPGWTPIFGMGVVSLREQGRNYARMLNIATPAIKEANSNAAVMVGGLASVYENGSCHPNLLEYISGIYEGRGQFDVMAIHAYGAPIWYAVEKCGFAVRDLMKKQRDKRPLWLTEFGIDDAQLQSAWPHLDTPEKVDEEQRNQWEQVVKWNDSNGVYARLIGYVLYDHHDYGYSIVRVDKKTVRPTYTWLKQRNGG